jgi:hypothetical protein
MIRYQRYDECRTWYIVFDRPRSRHSRWWRIFTGRQFAHCWAFTEAGEGMIRYEPLRWGLCCTYEPTKPTDMAELLIRNGVTALLSVTVDYRTANDWVIRGPYSCVSSLKALLALRKWGIFTPFALYKYLVRNHDACIPIKAWAPFVEG